MRVQNLYPALSQYAIDSGGFTEISTYGEWRTSAPEYIAELRRLHDNCGPFDFAPAQDWMCEPFILRKTGLTIADHQDMTISSYMLLRRLAPDLPIIPVLQGWRLPDYLAHVDQYDEAGIDLSQTLVGVGSVCRRQNTAEAGEIFATLHKLGLRLHGFGIKKQGINMYHEHLESADSLAWSFRARIEAIRLPGHKHQHCGNCFEYAHRWRDELLAELI